MKKKKVTKEQMIERCGWLGTFVAYHSIGIYSIVEYKAKVFDGDGVGLKSPREYEKKSSFSSFVNGQSTNYTHHSLEASIAHAIAYKFDGANTRAGEYFIKSIKK